MATVKLYFRWDSLQPDHRQWKPSNPLINPIDIMIAVDVPLDHKYVDNAEQIIVAQLSNQTPEIPVLTPAGMRYCIDQFENEMSDKVEKVTANDNEEWEEISDIQEKEWK